jgi:hypothetical protein
VAAKNDLAEFKRRWGTTPGFKRSYRDQLQKAREQYVAYLNAQLEDGDEEVKAAYGKGELEHSRRTDDDFVEKNEKIDHNYIESGRFRD